MVCGPIPPRLTLTLGLLRSAKTHLALLSEVTYPNMLGIHITELFTKFEAGHLPFSATTKFCREIIIQGLTLYSVMTTRAPFYSP